MSAPPPRKAAIRSLLLDLAELAKRAGLGSMARELEAERLRKLEEERFSLVVLGEFNHGKSTFINALVQKPVLPVGITPTTAVLTHLRYGEKLVAQAVKESGARQDLDPAALGDWLTVEGKGPAAMPSDDPLAYVEIALPAPFLQGGVEIVDTPGVNDINQQRADITYGYVPRADAAVFLLDATQILTASERTFLQERILRSSRDRLVFVVTKADQLEPDELAQALAFAREHLEAIVPGARLFAISAKRALAGHAEEGRMAPLLDHLALSLGAERRRLIYDHALADAGRVAGFLRQSLSMRRRSLALPVGDLEERVGRAKQRLLTGRKALAEAGETIRAETAALKARVRQDLQAFSEALARDLPGQIEPVGGADVKSYLPAFIEDTWKRWLEAQAESLAAELERLAERVIQVANESAAETTADVARELGGSKTPFEISVDTFKYDASVFALGALGTTVFLFVHGVAGGLLALAAPVAALFMRGRVAQEIKDEAKRRAPESVRQIAATVGPKLDETVEGFSQRLAEFVAEAGDALARGIAEVLSGALDERRQRRAAGDTSAESRQLEALGERLTELEGRIETLRQEVWSPT